MILCLCLSPPTKKILFIDDSYLKLLCYYFLFRYLAFFQAHLIQVELIRLSVFSYDDYDEDVTNVKTLAPIYTTT